jgi:hypothetical protein
MRPPKPAPITATSMSRSGGSRSKIRIDVRIVLGVMRELRRRFDVLVFAVVAHPLVALLAVFRAQRLRIEIKVRKQVVQSCSFVAHLLEARLTGWIAFADRGSSLATPRRFKSAGIPEPGRNGHNRHP